jgi:hypothetical protein
MTVTTTEARQHYATNGVATDFTVPFKFDAEGDLDVYFVNAAGTVSVPILNTDYTVDHALDGTGTLEFAVAPANAGLLVILRRIDVVQSTPSTGKEIFSAAEVEDIVDLMMYMIQQIRDISNRALPLVLTDPDGGGRYDANANRITDLADPEDAQDAVTMDWAETAGTSFVAQAAASAAAAASSATAADNSADAAADSADDAAASAADAAAISSAAGRPVLRNVAGTAQAATAETGLSYSEVTQYQTFLYNPALDNTGADPELNIDGTGLLTIKGPTGQAVAAGEIVTTQWYELMAADDPVTELWAVRGY